MRAALLSVVLALGAFAPTARASDWFATQLDLTDAYLTGKFEPTRYARFTKATASGLMLHKAAYAAFVQMQRAALASGIRLRVISATRNFDAQKRIWEKKWAALAKVANPRDRALNILQFSSMPGTSRHHWGTDVDLGHGQCADALCLEAPAWNGRAYQWLVQNAYKFGFCQPYHLGRSGYAMGYKEERWHWSFHPLARLAQLAYEQRIDRLAPNAASFSGGDVGAQVYKDFVRNVGCTAETRAMVREAMSAIGVPLSPPAAAARVVPKR